MVTETDIRSVLKTVMDPEMPVNIVDLGLIEHVELAEQEDGRREATVHVLPTFVGCPALHVIEADVRDRVADLPGVDRVNVKFLNDPPWSVERISSAGRAALKKFGVTVPRPGSCAPADQPPDPIVPLTITATPETVACPFCDSEETAMESRFGPTRCKMIYYCRACKNSFEHMKHV